jgi:hypothetical protein
MENEIMATNAATLISFGGELSVGDWIYSVVPRRAPAYLPLTNTSVSYLQSSYPALTAVLGSNNKFTYTIAQTQTSIQGSPNNGMRHGASGNGMAIFHSYIEYYSTAGANYWLLFNSATPAWTQNSPSFLTVISPFDIAYGNNIFACVGSSVSTPSTPINQMYFATKATILASGAWTARTLPDSLVWNGIAYDSNTNVWVAVTGAFSSNTARSTDGLATWTRGGVVIGPNASGRPIAAGNSTFTVLPYSVSGNGQYSINGGTTWANSTGFKPDQWNAIAYGNGVFVAVAANTTFPTAASSTNGITFTALEVPALGNTTNRQFNDVSYGNNVWCITSGIGANSTSGILTHAFSYDLITWTTASISGNTTTDNGANFASYAGANNEWFNLSRNAYGTRFVATANTTAFTLPLVTSQWGAIPYIKAS